VGTPERGAAGAGVGLPGAAPAAMKPSDRAHAVTEV